MITEKNHKLLTSQLKKGLASMLLTHDKDIAIDT